jgi:hypothetical protein
MRTEWVDGMVEIGRRTERVHAQVGPHVAGDESDPCLEGVFVPSPDLEVGRAVHLRLDDGRQGLVVVVGEGGRFLSVGLLE